MQVEQLDKLDQYTTPATEGGTAEDGELGELSKKFYQAAVQVCVYVGWDGVKTANLNQFSLLTFVISSFCRHHF